MDLEKDGKKRYVMDSLTSSNKKDQMFALLKELYEDDQIFLSDLNEMTQIVTGMSLADLINIEEVRKKNG